MKISEMHQLQVKTGICPSKNMFQFLFVIHYRLSIDKWLIFAAKIPKNSK